MNFAFRGINCGNFESYSPHSPPPFFAGLFQHKNKDDAEIKD
jgi:hypothetical protein